MVRIDGLESASIPYFLYWRMERGVYHHATSKNLPPGDYWDVVVATLPKDHSHIWFPLPNGIGLRRDIDPVDSWVCVMIECRATPPVEKTQYTYMVSFDEDDGLSILEISREGFDDLSQSVVRDRIRELMAAKAREGEPPSDQGVSPFIP